MSEDVQASGKGTVTIEAVIVRADGTVEDLGVIASGVVEPDDETED